MAKRVFFENSRRSFISFRIWAKNEDITGNNLLTTLKKIAIILGLGGTLSAIAFTDALHEIHYGQKQVASNKIFYFIVLSIMTQKIAYIAFSRNKVMACIHRLERMAEGYQDQSEFDNYHKLYRKLFVFGNIIINLSLMFFYAAPVLTEKPRRLPFGIKFFDIETQDSPNFELWLLFELICGVFISNSTISLDTLFCGMMAICAATTSSICTELREMDKIIDGYPKSDAKLKDIIRKIQDVALSTASTSDIFSLTTAVHLFSTSMLLSLALTVISRYPFTDLFCISMMSMSLLSTFLLWIYCYFGQEVVNQRVILRQELYFVRWYDASPNFKKMLCLTILEAQKDRFIYGAKVIPLSMQTFAEVLKKAYVLFTFVNETR